jgi:hypothetical protein
MGIQCTGDLTTGPEGQPLCSVPWSSSSDSFADLAAVIIESFATPPAEEIQAAFVAGISLPIICYLAAWGYQTVINFISRDH